MAPPKSGHRGALTSLALLRDTPYRREHDASVDAQPSAPTSWSALKAWFVDAWEASLPTRSHTRGVEDGSALGSPRMGPALHRRTDHASALGWGVTGWDKDGRPRGMNDEGLTRDPFLFHLEMRLRSKDERIARDAGLLVRWAYLRWDSIELTFSTFRRTLKEGAPILFEVDAMEALLERTIRQLWHDCQREPVRFRICATCRRRDCACGQRSEAQVHAEEASA